MTSHDDISDADIDGWLHTLGLTSLPQWDVLIFLYRHQISLVGADVIAHLLGYASEPVLAALDALEFLGLVDRSRVSQSARFYQFTVPPDPQRRDAWTRLLALAIHRAGRLRLAMRLRGRDHTAEAQLYVTRIFLAEAQESMQESRRGLHETRRSLAEAQGSIQASRRHLHPDNGGLNTWSKAI